MGEPTTKKFCIPDDICSLLESEKMKSDDMEQYNACQSYSALVFNLDSITISFFM